jgi:pimeloyl-ACP methyl ester carboxylesterase
VKKSVRPRFAALAVVAVASLAACSGGGIDNVESFETKVSWGDCKGKDAPGDPYECATVSVPVDYRDADGDTMKIALVRVPATGGKSKGIVLTNPGGPGGSGFDFIADAGTQLVSELGLEMFDIIGFDPRGVDRSGAVRCMTDKELDQFLYLDTTPDTPEEKKLDDDSDRFDTACTDKYGESLQHYSTEYTARDMDIIRASLGFEKIHYLGISYGTYLGGVYATLFPDRVAAMVLDGAFDPAGDSLEQRYSTQAEGFEKAFANWVTWCEDNEAKCAFHSDDVKADWLSLYESLDKTSLVVDKRDVNHEMMDTATKSALYAESMWGQLSQALAAATNGDGAGLMMLADGYNERSDDGTYASQSDSFYVINCASGMERDLPSDPEAFVKKMKSIAPWYYRNLEASDFDEPSCETGFGTPDIVDIDYNGGAPVVVVGGKNDPATPFRWSEKMVKNMGDNARLVAFSGEGHSQILVSSCVDEIAGALLVKGTLPKKGTVCDPDEPLAQPAWWKSTVQVPGIALDTDTFNSFLGLEPAKAFARYFAHPGTPAAAFAAYSRALRSKGLQWSEGEETDPTKSGQWFFDGVDLDKFVGLYMVDTKDLEKYSMLQPKGSVPKGHTVVAVYYYP